MKSEIKGLDKMENLKHFQEKRRESKIENELIFVC